MTDFQHDLFTWARGKFDDPFCPTEYRFKLITLMAKNAMPDKAREMLTDIQFDLSKVYNGQIADAYIEIYNAEITEIHDKILIK